MPVALVALGLSGWLRRILALPVLFETLVRGAVIVALPVALVLAWKYPSLGHTGELVAPPESSSRGDTPPEA